MVTPSVRMVSLPMVGLGRAAGPIFDKEMRVASRRIRYYALRAAYAGALTFLVMVTWSSTMRTGSALVLASRMPEVAKTVTTAITWLQFLAAQGLAVILLSSAIGEEVRKGTLGVLLTTPISSLQIVVGKLLSRMLQILVSLAISLPVLAILRLLGGVPWDYVLAGACITLTTTLFAGALSLWLSTHSRYGSQAISTSLLLIFVVHIIPVTIFPWLGPRGVVNTWIVAHLMDLANPFHVLYQATSELWSPAGPTGATVSWGLNSLVMLSLALILLLLTVRRVRRVAVAGIDGARRSAKAAVGRAAKRFLWSAGTPAEVAGPIRRVAGSPVVWKETRRGLLYGWSLSDIVISAIALAASVIPVIIFGATDVGSTAGVGMVIGWFLSVLVLVRLAVTCAGNVPRERETRTWPILLTTPLEDREIVYGKAKAALLRNGPLLITLAAIYLFFLVVFPRPETLFIAGMGLASQVVSILLVVGIGSYFGVTVRTRGSAVVATIAVCLVTKYVISGLFLPVVGAMTMGAGGGGGGVAFGFCVGMLFPALIQVTIAIAAIQVAAQRVRHDVF